MINPVVEQCWEVRAKLVKQFGGLDGLFDELQRLDRKRLTAKRTKKKSSRASTGTTRLTRSTPKKPKAS